MRQQKGFVFKTSGAWYVKYRENVSVKGKVERKLKTHRLADVNDYCRTQSQAERLATEFLRPFNEGKVTAHSSMSLSDFVERHWFPSLQSLRDATVYGYRQTWHDYMEKPFGKLPLRDIKRTDTVPYLRKLQQTGARVARSAKAVGSAIYSYANLLEIVEHNPFAGRLLPKHERTPQHATTLNEVAAQLAALKDKPQARAAIGLGYFAGLRPAEIRGVKWEDYDARMGLLMIRCSVWRTIENGTKTQDAEGLVPIKATLA